MSDETPAYSRRLVHAWSVFSIAIALVLLGMFFFGHFLMYGIGRPVWDLLRWIFSPII